MYLKFVAMYLIYIIKRKFDYFDNFKIQKNVLWMQLGKVLVRVCLLERTLRGYAGNCITDKSVHELLQGEYFLVIDYCFIPLFIVTLNNEGEITFSTGC